MNLISILGLLTLLGLAWAMSYHRWEVKLRPIVWGLGLQFLFALIILREDQWSFVGMGLLGALIIAFLMHREAEKAENAETGENVERQEEAAGGGREWALLAGAIGGGLAVGFVLVRFLPAAIPALFVVVLLFLLVNGRFRFLPAVQRWAGCLLVASGVAWLVSRNLSGEVVFDALSNRVKAFLELSDWGAKFLFADLVDPANYGFFFAFRILPTIIFFGGFMGVLYYLGVMQKVIDGLSRFMRWTIGTSGAETMSCSANIFVGQTEGPLLIKPFLERMTRSELLTVMVGGFATIAGGVLAAYIGYGVPAGHLIAASVMSAPAALVVGKIIYPELEHSQTAGDIELPEIDQGDNVIEAATNGISDGLKLAVNVGAMLIGFIALIAVVDVSLNWLDGLIDGDLLGGAHRDYAAVGLTPVTGEFIGYFPGSLQTLFGTLLSPLAWLMGVPWEDAAKVGNLLGVKLSLTELVAYGSLGNYIQAGELSDRSVIISTYALCGFANFSSVGIQIGGISAVAPGRRKDLSKVALKAMFGGAIASWLTATIAGILIG